MIIGITGTIRSGKDTFADYLVSKYGFVKLNMSDVLRDELKRNGKEASKENMSLLGDEWRKKYGMGIVMKRTLKNAKRYEKAVICGIRSMEEVKFVRTNTKDFWLIAITAAPEIRFARRNELDPQDFNEFLARDERDIKNKGLDKVMNSVDYTIMNNYSSLEQLHKEIELSLKNLNL